MAAIDTSVVVIGAGMSGLAFGVQIQRWYGIRDFEIYEQSHPTSSSAGASGTWYINQYPAAGVDVPSAFYSFSFHQNPNWSRKFCMRDEIQDYLNGMSKEYGLREKLTFGVHCKGADWDEEAHVWRVLLQRIDTKETFVRVCRVFVTAVGGLGIPRECDIPGTERFRGALFHSAKWDHGVQLAGKDVIVVGNGCSATQFVPELVKVSKRVVQFARQPHWVEERKNPERSSWFRWTMKHVPFALQLVRLYYYADMEKDFLMFHTKGGKQRRDTLRAELLEYVDQAAPPKYRDLLIPDFEIGCKRRVFDTFYFDCLWRENMELTNDTIVEIVEDGVRTASGRHVRADAIVLATGFAAQKFLVPMEIRGRHGISLNEHWRKQGGPQAYLGTCFANFPNLYTIFGLNTATGHLSVLYTTECQVNLALRSIKPLLYNDATSIEVKQEAETADNKWIQSRLKNYVWSTGCSSWYLDSETGRNEILYPHFQWHYWLRTVFLSSRHFVTTYTAKGRAKLWTRRILRVVLVLFLTFAARQTYKRRRG